MQVQSGRGPRDQHDRERARPGAPSAHAGPWSIPACSQWLAWLRPRKALICTSDMPFIRLHKRHATRVRWAQRECHTVDVKSSAADRVRRLGRAAAQRRLMVWPLGAFGSLHVGRTIPCLFEQMRASSLQQSCAESRAWHDGARGSRWLTCSSPIINPPFWTLYGHCHARPSGPPVAAPGSN